MGTVATGQHADSWTFDDLPVGRPPAGFVFVSAPADQIGRWSVVRDGGSLVLAHLQQRWAAGTQLAIVDGTSLGDVALSARLRFTDGAGAAGVVWRYRDRNNYYLALLDLRAQDVRIYRIAGGNRTRLEDEDDLELEPGAWQTFKIEHRGIRIRVWVNGVPVADARDRTNPEPGAIGVWTASDSGTWFDDLRAERVVGSQRNGRRE
jgi:hypothetical protein